MRRRIPVLAVVLMGLWACSDSTLPTEPGQAPERAAAKVPAPQMQTSGVQYTGHYIVLGRNNTLPANLAESLGEAGGTLLSTMPAIGVAVAEAGTDPAGFRAAASAIPGVESVTPDLVLQWTEPVETRAEMVEALAPQAPAAAGVIEDNAVLGSFQWAPQAIQAPEAWAAGYTGTGVRVAILDGGLWDQHQDLVENVDVAASASFVPGYAFNEDVGTFWHGTHVAGIVAGKGHGIFGVAPNATLVGVKVLHGGSGAFEWVLGGILYAATPASDGGPDVDLVNMSLGATLPYHNTDAWKDPAFRKDFLELAKAFDRAVRYAYQNGVAVIASAGNDGANYDKDKGLYKIPAESDQVIAVSATAPHGWAYYPADDFYRPTFYTDHGKSLLNVAAPGGTPGLFVIDGVDAFCGVSGTFLTLYRFCAIFDMVMSSARGAGASTSSYAWAYGTSMAAPAATGVAALIIQSHGGEMNPRALRSALEASSIDLGKPGKDEWYGHGWVNAYRGVMR